MFKFLSKLPVIMTALAMMVLCASCSGGSDDTPEAVAQGYVQALAAGDSEALLKLIDTKGASENDLKKIGGKLQILVAQAQSDMQKRGGLNKVECEEVKIDGNNASMFIIIYYQDGSTDRQRLRLMKNDQDEWKVLM